MQIDAYSPPAARRARRILALWLACAVALCGSAEAAHARPAPTPPAPTASASLGAPTWSDEFDGAQLDASKWSPRATGPRNDGVLTPEAVSVGNGVLRIKTYTEGGKHYSGMISTAPHDRSGFEQAFGYWEARMRFHDAPGEWSAFWLQSRDIGRPMGDPATAGVEMDVVEHRARCVEAPLPAPPTACGPDADITDRIQEGLIWDGYANRKSAIKLSDRLAGLGNDSWHTFGLLWTPTKLTFYYDDRPIWSMDGPISRHGQYIVLSSEVDADFAGAIPATGYGSRDATTTGMEVDYVRVWAGSPGASVAAPTPKPAPPPTAPQIIGSSVASGPPAPGQVLTCSPGAWVGAAALRYQWFLDGVPLPGATSPTRTVEPGDRGRVLTCTVTGSNDAGAVSVRSNAMAVPEVARRVRPTVVTTIPCASFGCDLRVRRAGATATVRVPATGRVGARTYKPTATAATSAGGRAVTVTIRLGRATRTSIARALRAGRPVVAKLRVSVRDRAGRARTLVRRIPLKL